MSIKKKTVFETSDGKTFDEEFDAEVHEARIDLFRIVRDSGMGSGSKWTPEMIASVISEYAKELHPILFKLAINTNK